MKIKGNSCFKCDLCKSYKCFNSSCVTSDFGMFKTIKKNFINPNEKILYDGDITNDLFICSKCLDAIEEKLSDVIGELLSDNKK